MSFGIYHHYKLLQFDFFWSLEDGRNEGEEVAQRTCEHDPDNDVTITRGEFYKCGHKQKHPSGWELLTWDI